ncbi:hypothetical protein LCGC14_0692750 [marine sediment metagenome]|uniref:Uncharacterized protein n=1 Tax=marine sediment metagenome TaxID=412755 RepID=A0A0F9TSX0_9ZZZZ
MPQQLSEKEKQEFRTIFPNFDTYQYGSSYLPLPLGGGGPSPALQPDSALEFNQNLGTPSLQVEPDTQGSPPLQLSFPGGQTVTPPSGPGSSFYVQESGKTQAEASKGFDEYVKALNAEKIDPFNEAYLQSFKAREDYVNEINQRNEEYNRLIQGKSPQSRGIAKERADVFTGTPHGTSLAAGLATPTFGPAPPPQFDPSKFVRPIIEPPQYESFAYSQKVPPLPVKKLRTPRARTQRNGSFSIPIINPSTNAIDLTVWNTSGRGTGLSLETLLRLPSPGSSETTQWVRAAAEQIFTNDALVEWTDNNMTGGGKWKLPETTNVVDNEWVSNASLGASALSYIVAEMKKKQGGRYANEFEEYLGTGSIIQFPLQAGFSLYSIDDTDKYYANKDINLIDQFGAAYTETIKVFGKNTASTDLVRDIKSYASKFVKANKKELYKGAIMDGGDGLRNESRMEQYMATAIAQQVQNFLFKFSPLIY